MTDATEIEIERRRRIRIALYAFAYELADDSMIDDHTFDRLALEIRPEISTGHEVMDKFFREDFGAHTGSWVNSHPELDKLAELWARLKLANARERMDDAQYKRYRKDVIVPVVHNAYDMMRAQRERITDLDNQAE